MALIEAASEPERNQLCPFYAENGDRGDSAMKIGTVYPNLFQLLSKVRLVVQN